MKLLKLLQLGIRWIYNTIIVIVDRLIKAAKFRPIEESITAEELAYKVNNVLFAEHGL